MQLEMPLQRKAFGYARVSTTQQVNDGISMDLQQTLIKNFCYQNNLFLTHIYTDPGISAKDMIHRPQLLQLLEDITPDAVLVTKCLDRLTRSVADLQTILTQINSKGACLVFLDYKVDTSTIMGKAMIDMMSVMAEVERKNIAARVTEGVHHYIKKGGRTGRAPYGFKFIDKKLVPEPSEQLIFSRIKEIIKDLPDSTPSNIATILESEGVKLRKSKKIYPNKIRDIINNNNLRPTTK